MTIAQLLTAILSDVLLIVSPIWVVQNTRLDPRFRFRLVFVFSASVLTTLAAIAHIAIVLVTTGPVWAIICGVIEVDLPPLEDHINSQF